jgi:GxxExxY protein
VIVEVKAVEKIVPVHEMQLLTYLKLADRSLGLLINFNVMRLADGVRRIVHNFPDNPAVSLPQLRPRT